MFKSSLYHTASHHIYYDISLYNNNQQPTIAKLIENRSQPLLQCPSDYYLSVIRFLIPTAYLPIFVYPTNYDGNGKSLNTANNTSFSVTIRNQQSGIDYQTFIIYQPLNNLSSLDAEFLFVYSYQQFIDMINVAFNTAFVNLVGGGGPNLPTTPPYMTFDPITGLCSIIVESVYASATGFYQIFMNNPLFTFFDNFKASRLGVGNVNGKDDLLFVDNQGDNTVTFTAPAYSSTVTGYKIVQEYNSLFNWNTVRSIVFVTNTVPCADENINLQSPLATTGSTFRKILTDFEPQIQTNAANNTLRSYQQYYPVGQYRLIDLKSDRPLYTFDIQVYFETADQTLYPLYINSGEYISMKILFQSRDIKVGL